MNAHIETNRAKEQAGLQMSSIRDMLAAVNCDYGRLEDLREELADLESEANDDTNVVSIEAREFLADWHKENDEELSDMVAAAGDCEGEESARARIQEDPLSIQVRSGWYTPGDSDVKPGEFEILLCTGGPAVRIRGDLDDHGQPTRAYLQYQDWNTPWTDYYESGAGADLLEYATHFFYGE